MISYWDFRRVAYCSVTIHHFYNTCDTVQFIYNHNTMSHICICYGYALIYDDNILHQSNIMLVYLFQTKMLTILLIYNLLCYETYRCLKIPKHCIDEKRFLWFVFGRYIPTRIHELSFIFISFKFIFRCDGTRKQH